jgi:PAS domain S-box-containing protein
MPMAIDPFLPLTARSGMSYEEYSDKLSQQSLVDQILTHLPVSVLVCDVEGCYCYASPGYESLLGYKAEELIGTSMFKGLPSESVGIFLPMFDQWRQAPAKLTLEIPAMHKEGHMVWIEVDCMPITYDNGDLAGCMILARDITARREAESALKTSEERFRAMMEASPEIFTITDVEGKVLYNSPAATRLFGFSEDEMTGHSAFENIHPDDAGFEINRFEPGLKPGTFNSLTRFRFRSKDGRYLWVEANTSRQLDNPYINGLISIVRDISENIRIDNELHRAIEEKNLLIGEIHHRVKNNLQILTTLINLQVRSLQDETIRMALREIQGRITSMSLVHEMLYQSDSINQISIAPYMRSLSTGIITCLQSISQTIHLNLDVDDELMNIDSAVPLGLVVNELITNCCKYAFRPGEPGIISISLKKLSDGNWELVVEDNGVGIPEDIDPKNAATLGLRIVNELTEQLHGSLRFERCKGTRCILDFRTNSEASQTTALNMQSIETP